MKKILALSKGPTRIVPQSVHAEDLRCRDHVPRRVLHDEIERLIDPLEKLFRNTLVLYVRPQVSNVSCDLKLPLIYNLGA
jgi:hypothetical protein